jgi:hypothetical protein
MIHRRILPLVMALCFSFAAPAIAIAKTIAVIGTGSVGSALGPRFAEIGYTVVYGSRTPERKDVQALVAATSNGATLQPLHPRQPKWRTSFCWQCPGP